MKLLDAFVAFLFCSKAVLIIKELCNKALFFNFLSVCYFAIDRSLQITVHMLRRCLFRTNVCKLLGCDLLPIFLLLFPVGHKVIKRM